MSGLRRLRDALPTDRFIAGPSRGGSPARDLCRYPTGEALAWVRPRSTKEVSLIVRTGAETGTPVVAVGARTAYWWPLRYEGAIALDTSGLGHIDPGQDSSDPVWVGAGVSVRDLDEHLRLSGRVLPCHPDAYGDTSVAAMVATGFTSGCGVGAADLSSLVAGIKVVLGTGEVLTCGASAALGGSPFLRAGLPDPTELFFASDGALGVVTEVAVRSTPWCPLARLTWQLPGDVDGLGTQARLAGALRSRGLYETLRAVQRWDRGQVATITEADLVLRAPAGSRELDGRIAYGSDVVRRVAGVEPVCVQRETPGGSERVTRWAGDPGGAWRELGALQLVGVDVNLPYAAAPDVLEISESILAQAQPLPWLSLRRAMYGGHDHLNLGLHVALEAPGPEPVPGAHELVEWGIERLSALDIVPYRWGRLWGGRLGGKLDPAYLRVLRAMKASCDPAGVLHPGASLWDA